VEEVALLKSAERQKILVEGAKKEGRLMFYTALIVDQVVRPVKAAFEKEYPFIQLEFFRGNSDRLAQKILAEYQAKRYDVDVISGSGATTVARQAGYLQKFFSPHTAEYPAELKDPQSFWGATNVYFMLENLRSPFDRTQESGDCFRSPNIFTFMLSGSEHENSIVFSSLNTALPMIW
jgi:iron(III) transport system substrate-binding protein